jgi:hypothetical protein
LEGCDMTKFVLVFRNEIDHQPTEEEYSAWMAWFAELGSAIADPGAQVAESATLGNGSNGSVLSGYTVIHADDLTQANYLAAGCPALTYGGGVEIGQLLQM